MSDKTEMVSAPRELLERLLGDACNENWSDLNRLLATCRAAPAEDVREVVDEPVAFQWRRKTVVEGSQWSRWVDCTADDYNAIVASPGPSDRGIIREGRKLYRHPQRSVVMPERRPDVNRSFEGSDAEWYGNIAWNACLDEFERLNK